MIRYNNVQHDSQVFKASVQREIAQTAVLKSIGSMCKKMIGSNIIGPIFNSLSNGSKGI